MQHRRALAACAATCGTQRMVLIWRMDASDPDAECSGIVLISCLLFTLSPTAEGSRRSARRSATEPTRFQRPELSRPDLVLTLPGRPYPDPTSSRGKGAWPATDAAAGGDRAGLGWRGLLQRVRAFHRWEARPPSA